MTNDKLTAKAREIAVDVTGYDEGYEFHFTDVMEAARLGIIEGLEMAAKVVEDSDYFPEEGAHIAATIRALIEEQKV